MTSAPPVPTRDGTLVTIGAAMDAYTAGQVGAATAPLNAEIVTLQQELAAAQKPPAPKVSFNAQIAMNYAGHEATYALEMVKQQAGFTTNDPNKPPLGDWQKLFSGEANSFATPLKTYTDGKWFLGDWPVFCGESWVQSEFAALLAAFPSLIHRWPTGSTKPLSGCAVVIDQENQINWNKAGLNAPATVFQSRAWWQQNMATAISMIKAANLAGKVLSMLDLTQYWSVEEAQPGNDYTAAEGLGIDLLAGDCYSTVAEAKTPQRMFDWLIAGGQKLGVPIVVAELGLHCQPGSDMNAALKLAESWWSYLDSQGNAVEVVAVTNWQASDTTTLGTNMAAPYNALIHRG